MQLSDIHSSSLLTLIGVKCGFVVKRPSYCRANKDTNKADLLPRQATFAVTNQHVMPTAAILWPLKQDRVQLILRIFIQNLV